MFRFCKMDYLPNEILVLILKYHPEYSKVRRLVCSLWYSLQEVFKYNCLSYATKSGYFDLVKWLCDQKHPLTFFACSGAAYSGNLEMLRYLRSRGCPWNSNTCSLAAKKGHLDILRYAYENNCCIDSSVKYSAASEGHFHILEWLNNNDIDRWDERTCFFAAKGGHLQVLCKLKENGCPWDKWTCAYAAEGGHLEILEWLYEQGLYPEDPNICISASVNGRLDVLQWAHEHHCPWDKEKCLKFAREKHHKEIIAWIENKNILLGDGQI